MYGRYYTSTTLNLGTFLKDRRIQETNDESETADPSPRDAFPQLGTPQETVQQAARELWADTDPSIRLSYPPGIRAPNANSPNANPRRVHRRHNSS